MKRVVLPLVASLALLAVPLLGPDSAPAQAVRGMGRMSGGGIRPAMGPAGRMGGQIPPGGGAAFGHGPAGRGPFVPPHGFGPQHRFGHRRFFSSFVPFGVVTPWYAYAPPWFYDSSFYGPYGYNDPPSYDLPVYYDPPAAYAPPPNRVIAIAPTPAPPPPPPPPAPTSVQYPTGRYEMFGDGVNAPFRWVWIPNPPQGPPPYASPAGTPPPGDPDGPRRSVLYRWTDEDGVLHMTDRIESVPIRYRGGAKQSS